ncbi:MAG: ImcF-related family protein [Janthinobacterium lividum]
MILYVCAALAFLFFLILTLAVGAIRALHGAPLVVVRVLLLLLGFVAAAALVWLARRRARSAGKHQDGQPVDTAPLDDLLREANRKLSASSRAGAKRLSDLPLVYLLGEASSAKTTAIMKSGLEAELLAGQVFREKDVVSTAVVNIWYSGSASFVEAGEALRQTPGLWTRLIALTRPGVVRAAFQGAPFRAAVVCVSCEQFMGQQTSETMKAAASLQAARLRELARGLGTQIPTYVLLTKLDRVPGFTEFVRNLSPEEGFTLFGAAPELTTGASGSHMEQALGAASRSYDELLFTLGEARLDVLYRETDPQRLGPAYEFPRELRRFRNLLSTYLVELVKPIRLDSNPYLRGFYFTGVRAIVQQQIAASPHFVASAPSAAADATGVFSTPQVGRATPMTAPAAFGEKLAQWTFLPRFFPEAVLGDRTALGATAQTGRGKLFLRALYGGIALLALVYLALLTGSYFANVALQQRVQTASDALAASPASGTGPIPVQQLTQLDDLRLALAQLELYRIEGAPLRYRWGLYRGDRLLDPARNAYFTHFRALLLNRTQSNIVAKLAALPATPGANPADGADYNGTYASLRAYLITTSNAEKSTVDFLPPVMLQHLAATGALGTAEQSTLAERQFAYYASVLLAGNPYAIVPAGQTVAHARGYLSSFGGFERIYQSILTASAKAGPAIQFNLQHPGSATVVVEPHTIESAFTQPGYAFVQDAMSHPERYFRGEAWVLGDQAPPSIDAAAIRTQLANRYTSDYIARWRAFVKDATVVRYTSLPDAGEKLGLLSSNSSPLLALMYTVSRNTAVANPQIASAFQAPQALVPGGAEEVYIGASNKAYVDALLALNGAVKQATQAANPNDPAAATPVNTAASAAQLAAQQSAQAFHIDSQAHVDAATLALMLAPITNTEALVRGLGPAQVNAGAKGFCSAFSALFAKAPFNLKSNVQATPAEVSALLQPGTGSLWQFYNGSLKTLLLPQGAEYVAAPNQSAPPNPDFVKFFSRAALLSQEMFPAGATAPTLAFDLKNMPASGIQSTTLKVDAQSLTNAEASKRFTWSSQTAHDAGLSANGLPLTFSGTWAVFELFNKARVQKSPAGYELGFPLEVANTAVKAPDGTPLVVRYELSGPGADVLAPGALSSLRCVSVAVR